MNHIKAIGFDLFNTLITVRPHTIDEAMDRLISSLVRSGFSLEDEPFRRAHHEAAMGFVKESRQSGRETHNRFWISAALKRQGYSVDPQDPQIAQAVDEYFTAFTPNSSLIPGTKDMLEILTRRYRLGLLSNFTHAPAAKKIIDHVGLTPFFDVLLISGELGYRKPHPLVFRKLTELLGVRSNETLFVGDDPEPDIRGAQGAGLQPVWITYVQDKNVPSVPGALPKETGTLDSVVPRISVWKELLVLLGIDDLIGE